MSRPRLFLCLTPLLPIYLAAGAAFAQDSQAAIRDVSPPGVTRPVSAGEWLRRPVEQPRPAAVAPRPALTPLQNVHVRSDGVLRAGKLLVHLPGVAMPQRNMICTTEAGTRWACGSAAFAAWSNMFSGKVVMCDIKDPAATEVTAPCQVNGVDAGTVLVANGWATTETGGQNAAPAQGSPAQGAPDLSERQRLAQETRRGV